MKPTFKTTALAILISLGAVACGSSGGGSSSTEQKQPVVKQNPKLQKQESNKTTAVKTENKKIEKTDKPEKVEKVEKAEKVEKVEKPVNINKENKNLDNQLKSLNDKLAELEKSTLEAQNQALKAQNDFKQAIALAQTQSKDKATQELQRVKESLANAKAQLQQLKNERNELNDHLDQVNNELRETLDKLDSAQIQANDAEYYKQRLQEIGDQYDESNRTIDELNAKLDEANQKIYNYDELAGLDKYYESDRYNRERDLENKKIAAEKEEKRLQRAKERENVVSDRVISSLSTKDANELAKFVDISADGTRSDGYTKKITLNRFVDPDEPKLTAYTSYNYNLEDAGISVLKKMTKNAEGYSEESDKENVFVFYGGNPTKASQLPELQKTVGTATYQGKLTSDMTLNNHNSYDKKVRPVESSITLTVDFKNKSIEGIASQPLDQYDTSYDYYTGYSEIKLEKTRIDTFNDALEFKGKAKQHISTTDTGYSEYKTFETDRTGQYEGKFMGPQAEQVAGAISLEKASFKGSMTELDPLNAVFVAEKQ
ncbi:transferrin-binding protein-like solute binding protein [Pasteurellaceae bacterium TAE3-ERU1]|nr:transferrin-binding protein-like solute binding protein [Pasteurellaceae bacterium TAE3-ERU1]